MCCSERYDDSAVAVRMIKSFRMIHSTDSPKLKQFLTNQSKSIFLGRLANYILIDQTSPSSNTQDRGYGSLTFTNGLALVLGLQIGSGIFSAPSQVSNHVLSPGMAVVVWLLAGMLVWTGAASFIELGLAIPRNGGVQEYLRVCYGELLGFLFSWIWIAISKACANATIGIVFAENLVIAFAPRRVHPLIGRLIGLSTIIYFYFY